MTTPPLLTSPRLVLRPWCDADAPALYPLASDPEVGPRAGWPPHTSEQESLHIIRTVFANPTTWAVTLRADGTLIGAIGYALVRLLPARLAWRTHRGLLDRPCLLGSRLLHRSPQHPHLSRQGPHQHTLTYQRSLYR